MDIQAIMAGLEVGKGVLVEMITVQVRRATKEGAGYRLPEHDGRVFVALNATDKLGNLYDVEIADASGFVGPLFDPDSEAAVDFRPPAPGAWIKIKNARVSHYLHEGRRKFKVRINSAFQLREVGALGRMMPVADDRKPSRRVKARAV